MAQKARLTHFDLLRCIAALAVIAIHITGRYIKINNVAFALNVAVRFAVPMFIILSGYLLYYSSNKNQTLLPFLNKRLKKTAIPFILWTLIYLLYAFSLKPALFDAKAFAVLFAQGLLFGKGTSHLYFVVIIVQMYILYLFIEKGFEKGYEKMLLGVSFAITLYFQLGIYLFKWYIYILPNIHNYIVMFPTWLFFFVFGMYAAKNHERMEEWLKKYPLQLAVFWFASYLVLLLDSKLTNTYGGSAKPTIMLYCMASFMFFFSASLNLKIENKAVTWFSEQSFFIYLAHVLVIFYIFPLPFQAGFKTLWVGMDGMVLLYIATTLTTCLLAYLLSYVPYADFLGVSVKRKQKVGIVRNPSL